MVMHRIVIFQCILFVFIPAEYWIIRTVKIMLSTADKQPILYSGKLWQALNCRAVESRFNLVKPSAYDGRNCDEMAAQVATVGGCRRGMCPLPRRAWKL